ncbi:hypothetical protein [Pseudomonas sp. TH49]|nr:hypothetical protein [Pseudomonas sp. TH49]
MKLEVILLDAKHFVNIMIMEPQPKPKALILSIVPLATPYEWDIQ